MRISDWSSDVCSSDLKAGQQDMLYLGNLDAKRDWGHAREYVEGMWLMLQQDRPDDYVLATGVTTTVRQFVEWAFADVDITINWTGSAIADRGDCAETGRTLVQVDPCSFRPTEVVLLLGNPAQPNRPLVWTHSTTIRDLAREMGHAD